MSELESRCGRPTMYVRKDAIFEDEFQKSFSVLGKGRYIMDQNDDLWFLIDDDGTHLVYVRDTRQLGDRLDKSSTVN